MKQTQTHNTMDKLHKAAAEYAQANDYAKHMSARRWEYLEAFTKRTGLAAREDHMFSDGCLREYEELEELENSVRMNADVARERMVEIAADLYGKA